MIILLAKKNYIIKYTDELHPVAISDLQSFINPIFYNKYKDIIINAFIDSIKNSQKKIIHISKIIFSDYLLNEILKLNDISLYLDDIELTNEQLKKIKDKHINCFIKRKNKLEQISSKYAFSFHTIEELEQLSKINIFLDELLNNDIKNLKYLKENSIIIFNIDIDNNFLLENDKLSLLKEKLLELDSLNKKFIVKIKVERRSIFNKIFKDIKFNNIDLVINNDLYDYPYDEYLKEEEKLDNLIKDIKDKDFSPLEKFLAIYEIVKNYKPYKENKKDLDKARYLRYILDNEYMVCVGYTTLLITLLDKVDINAIPLSVDVDTSYDKGNTLEEKTVYLEGHQRLIVSLDDDKYNIHGLYISDPTWDNNLDKNYLNHCLLTFDKMQIDKRMFQFNYYNPILDIHNFQEYNEQVNFLLKRKIKENKDIYKDYPFFKLLIITYKQLGLELLSGIKCDKKYKYFLNLLKECKKEDDYINFYTELGVYLLTRINKPYKQELIFNAYKEILIKKGISNANMLTNLAIDNYYEKDTKQFPYEISSDSKHKLDDKKL